MARGVKDRSEKLPTFSCGLFRVEHDARIDAPRVDAQSSGREILLGLGEGTAVAVGDLVSRHAPFL